MKIVLFYCCAIENTFVFRNKTRYQLLRLAKTANRHVQNYSCTIGLLLFDFAYI